MYVEKMVAALESVTVQVDPPEPTLNGVYWVSTPKIDPATNKSPLPPYLIWSRISGDLEPAMRSQFSRFAIRLTLYVGKTANYTESEALRQRILRTIKAAKVLAEPVLPPSDTKPEQAQDIAIETLILLRGE